MRREENDAVSFDDLGRLRRSVRAMDGFTPDVLAGITAQSIRLMLTARGWRYRVNYSALKRGACP